MTGTEWWKGGVSECSYLYYIYDWPTAFLDARPANYILCKLDGHSWKPIYIGQTDDLSQVLDKHQAMPGTDRRGATHIHVHFSAWETARLAEEADLLGNYSTLRSIQRQSLPRLSAKRETVFV